MCVALLLWAVMCDVLCACAYELLDTPPPLGGYLSTLGYECLCGLLGVLLGIWGLRLCLWLL
jgi:hypothetical protein